MKKAYLIAIGMFLISTDVVVKLIYEVIKFFGGTLRIGIAYSEPILDAGIRIFGKTLIAKGWMNDYLSPEVILTILGYILIAYGAWSLRSYGRRMTIAANGSIAAGITYIVFKLIPFGLEQERLLVPLFILILLRVLFDSITYYSIAKGMAKQVDGYLYMELEKDLMFGFQLYLLSAIVMNILAVGRSIDLVQIFYIAALLFAVGASIYYPARMYRYCIKLKIFDEKVKMGTDV